MLARPLSRDRAACGRGLFQSRREPLHRGSSAPHARADRIWRRLPGFLESFEPARGLPYLGDVARLEWLRHAAYHAADQAPLLRVKPRRRSSGAGGQPDFRVSPIGRASRVALSHRQHLGDEHIRRAGAPYRPGASGRGGAGHPPGLEVNVLRLDAAEHAFAAALGGGRNARPKRWARPPPTRAST